MRTSERRLLETALDRLTQFETDSIERLSRLEENLHLLRKDLVGDGQPGRIPNLEIQVDEVRAEQSRQRGIFFGISFVISAVISFLSRFLNR